MKHEKHNSGNGGMGQRGVTRPMAMHGNGGHNSHDQGQEHQHHQRHQEDHGGDGDHDSEHHDHDGGHMMSDGDRHHMLVKHHKQTLWIPWTVIALGAWMILAPLTFSYAKDIVQPSGGRSVWLSDDARVAAMFWSDILSGLGLLVFGWRMLTPNRPVSWWIACFIGISLTFAPLIFWAPTAVAYLNSTLVGAFVIALTILIPGMPNMIMYMKMGGDVPPGWSYCPSSWPQRWIMILPCFAGWMVSRYLAAFQMGYIDSVWEPFFGDGSVRVLNSDMSHMWPISDGGLGALSYTFEFLMGYMGASSRWRTMPWMVAFFGVLVIPLGLVHIFLVISQPVIVGAWCTLCLLAACIMLPMITVEIDEVMAMIQHMFDAKKRGEPLWKVFWKGGSPEGCSMDQRSTPLAKLPEKPMGVVKSSLWGISLPWSLVASAALGIWLMCAPAIFSTTQPASAIAHLGGAIIVVVAGICAAEVVRIGRYLNLLVSLVVAIAPWFLDGGNTISQVNALIVGLLVAGLAFPRGPKTETYGMWEKYVR